MKKTIAAVITAMILIVMPLSAFAADTVSRLVDGSALLSGSEKTALEDKLNSLSAAHKTDIIAVTDTIPEGQSAEEYADSLSERPEYASDAVLLLIDASAGEWYISTKGSCTGAFTDAGIEYIGKKIKPELSDGNYYAAIEKYASLCGDFLDQAKSGSPYDRGNLPREPLSLIWIPLSAVIGFILALITVGGMKGKLKSVRSQAKADSYVKDGSINITEKSDLFLYRNVTKTERAKEQNSGSSTHTSSSGTTHGGGGGKF